MSQLELVFYYINGNYKNSDGVCIHTFLTFADVQKIFYWQFQLLTLFLFFFLKQSCLQLVRQEEELKMYFICLSGFSWGGGAAPVLY